MGRFKLIRTGSAKVAVPMLGIVEPIDVVRDIQSCYVPGGVNALPYSFLLEAAEERLDDGIVPAVSLAAHARLQVVGLAEPPPGVTAVLGALI